MVDMVGGVGAPDRGAVLDGVVVIGEVQGIRVGRKRQSLWLWLMWYFELLSRLYGGVVVFRGCRSVPMDNDDVALQLPGELPVALACQGPAGGRAGGRKWVRGDDLLDLQLISFFLPSFHLTRHQLLLQHLESINGSVTSFLPAPSSLNAAEILRKR